MPTRIIPKGSQYWPAQSVDLPQSLLVRMYEDGYVGAWRDPDAKERFRATHEMGADIAYGNGWAGSGEGELVVPFVFHAQTFPGCWPGPAQDRGDCVSHSTKNAALLSLICEVVVGGADPVSGKLEGLPEVSAEGIKEGVLSTEAVYWWRGHGGDGWSCDHAAEVVTEQSGLWLRQNYPEFGFDLTHYSGSTAGKWGSRNPPDNILQFGKQHLARKATELQSFEELRDFLHNGYGVSSCGGEGFSSTRNEDGVSSRRGGWSHAMAYLGVDDRDATKSKYGGPLVLVQNSWAVWNSGPRTIMGTNIEIPEGSFWARWSDVQNRDMHAFSSIDGWPARDLPDFGATGRI